MHPLPDELDLASTNGETYTKTAVESIQTAIVPGYWLKHCTERPPRTLVVPTGRRLHIPYSISTLNLKRPNIHNARINLRPTNMLFHTNCSLDSLGMSKGMRFCVHFRARHKAVTRRAPNRSLNDRLTRGIISSWRVSQDCVKSLVKSHPSVALQVRFKISRRAYPHSTEFQDKYSLKSLRAIQIAKKRPYCDTLIGVDVQELGRRTRQMASLAHFGMTGETYKQAGAAKMTRSTLPAHCVYIGLGSNVGDCVDNIEMACKEMNNRGIIVEKTSFLYKTKPMYLENQQFFVNGVCEVYENNCWVLK